MRLQRSLPWRFLQILARVLTTLLFDLKVYGLRNVPARGGVLIVSNHQSNLDPVLMAVRLNRPLNYIAKSELFEGRFGGWLLRRIFNAFPVRQGAGGIGAVKETIQRLREGHILNIYPEGARTGDGQIGPMERGVALIIRRARVPVVPAVIDGSFQAWPKHRRRWCAHPIQIRFGRPMILHDLPPDEILQALDQKLRSLFADVRAHEPHEDPRRRSTHAVVHERALQRLPGRRAG